jgi:hypothetical protein
MEGTQASLNFAIKMDGWMDGWMMNGWMYGWMDGWMAFCII